MNSNSQGLGDGYVVLSFPPRFSSRTLAASLRRSGSFESLYREHVGAVYALCLRLTGQREAAEDCTQETFVAAWRALSAFEARSSLSTWLHRIAVNQVLARQSGLAAKLERLGGDGSAEFPPDRAGDDATPPLDLERAIESLPDGARHVLVLVGIYGYSHDEAAQALGVATGTCRAHLHRARRLLGERLELSETLP
jgi:RNA polymerase sigma-70 factor (ECF subfamily)